MLLFINQEFEKFVFSGRYNDVNATTQFFGSFKNSFAFIVEFYRIYYRVLLARIMTEINVFVLKRIECDFYFITALGLD